MHEAAHPRRIPARVRMLAADRVSLALCVVFLLAALFYLWTAVSSADTLALHGAASEPYNRLADAFLHFHLWTDRAPAELLNAPEPYAPAQHLAFVANYPDFALYGGHFYLTWGPAPVLVLLVPLHLLGFEPSGSAIILPFAIAGLGFALAALRVLLRRIGNVPLWMCVLAAFTVALSSAVPYLIRLPEVYQEAVAGGFCFTMAGIWLAFSALVDRRASLRRLALMSLCFGLATGSRPTLGLTALVLVPVYMSLRSTQPRRGLLTALAVPVCAGFLLLAAYNQARFENPLEFGTKYQLSHFDSYTAHWGDISYVPPGVWAYLIAPPRPRVLFPFVLLAVPQVSYPMGLPAYYYPVSEYTGGLLPMTPIVIFLAALPWIWRRRPELLGQLAFPLVVLAGAGIASLLFLTYWFFSTAERYAVDFTTLFLFGALATWLALAVDTRGRRRRLVRMGGGVLAAWGCLTGLAVSFIDIAEIHPSTWNTLEQIGSPLSTAIAAAVGHPVLAGVSALHTSPNPPESYSNLGSDVTSFWLGAEDQADLTIVSPDTRKAALVASVTAGPELRAGASLSVDIHGPGPTSHSYRLPAEAAEARIPVHLHPGLNRIVLSPSATATNQTNPAVPASLVLLAVSDLSLAGRY
jgi:hypothetical protein